MPIEFDIKLTPKDMFRFNMYQAYSGFQGWLSVALSVILFVAAGMTWGEADGTRTALYVLFGVVFLVYTPLTLFLRSKHAIAASEVLSGALHFAVDETGFTVSQKEASASLAWEQIYKMIATKNNVLVYSSRINAYIIPREQLSEKYKALLALSKKKLPKYRIRMKE